MKIFKYTIYKCPIPNAPFKCKYITVITDENQKAKAPVVGARRIDCFYGQSSLTREQMINEHNYVVQSKIA